MERDGRHSRTKERFWSAHFLAWEKSGLSQRVYCQRCNLSLSTFTLWRQKLRHNETTSVALVPVPLVNCAVSSDGDKSKTTGLSLVLGRRCRIEIGTDFHAGTFARLISVIEDM